MPYSPVVGVESMYHRPVMVTEILQLIENHCKSKLIVDATVGRGGHTERILGKLVRSCL